MMTGDRAMEQKEALLQQKIEQYADMMFKLAFSQMKNRQDAEDVVQEVFYQYIKNKKPFENEEHEKAWLIRVTLNACRKIWRSAWYKHSAPYTAAAGTAPETPDSETEKRVLEEERREEVLQAVFSLSRKYREVIHLFYFEEMSIQEICAVTGRKTNTVTSQLTRGREQLKKTLKEAYRYE